LIITGSTGLIGSALAAACEAEGHTCIRLVRGDGSCSPSEVRWDPNADSIPEQDRLEEADAVIHLAGRSIACRWTPANKAAIRDSRVCGTGLLAHTLAALDHPPPVLLSASASGYYGDTGDRTVDEKGTNGEGFLAGVCRDWESATVPAQQAGVRVVHLRLSPVLNSNGGMLEKLVPLFRARLGGRIGNGRQYMSWITLADVLGAVRLILETPSIRGPVNLAAPHSVTNAEFTRTLAHVLSRPALFPVPRFAAKLALGQMAKETALASSRIDPGVLRRHGYRFAHPKLGLALETVLCAEP